MIDTLGRFIIPYGRYKEIRDYSNGYFRVSISDKSATKNSGSVTAIIDRTGKEIVSKAYENHCSIGGNLHCGLIKMNLYKYWIPEKKGVSSYNKNYDGYMNVKGELVINDTTFTDAYDFSDNRAFVRNEKWTFFIIDTQGRLLSKGVYKDVIGESFKKGLALVKVESKWGLIDTAANFIVEPTFSGIYHRGIMGDYFFFEERRISSTSDDYETYYGICKINGTIVMDALMTDFDWQGFQRGLLRCMIQGRLTYVDKDGKVVWQEKESIPDKSLTNLNIDFMNEGEFYANSLPDNKEYFNGWSRSDNIPRKITDKKSADHIVRVYVNPAITDTFMGKYNGVTVFVENGTNTDLTFNAQDSRLYMNVQALDKAGVWRDIEYLPSSWCGNSYHTVILNAHHYWQFTAPVYEGDFKTKLRITLTYIDPTDMDKNTRNRNKKNITIYSNEYECSVNPGQFWRTGDYIGSGIMDPYW